MFKCAIAVLAVSVTSLLYRINSANIQSCNSDAMYTVSYSNGSWECLSCSKCPPGAKINQPCRYNSDTVCEQCPQDTFAPRGGSECKPCRNCEPGYYIKKQCSETDDRLCVECANGYYTEIINSLFCTRCSSCRPKEDVLRRCDGRNNTVCGNCDMDHYREASSLKCVPCSPCHDRRSVRVTECVRKLGKQSNAVCQMQQFLAQKDPTSVERTIFEDGWTSNTTLDPLIVTLPVVIIVSVICCALACVTLLRYLFKHRHKLSEQRLPENTAFDSDSITLIETEPKTKVLSKTGSEVVGGAKLIEESVEMDDLIVDTLLKHGDENETEIAEPPRDKTNRMTGRPAKTQISLGIRPV